MIKPFSVVNRLRRLSQHPWSKLYSMSKLIVSDRYLALEKVKSSTLRLSAICYLANNLEVNKGVSKEKLVTILKSFCRNFETFSFFLPTTNDLGMMRIIREMHQIVLRLFKKSFHYLGFFLLFYSC